MSIKFFGHYLLDEGKITAEQLTQAVDYQSSKNLSLGEIAVRENLITTAEAEKINDKQRSLDKRFGEVAISLGLLSETQIEKLLTLQKEEKIFFGQALVAKNVMDKENVEKELKLFEEQQKIEVVNLDDKIAAHDKDDVMKTSIAVLQRLYLRIVHNPIKLVNAGECSIVKNQGSIVSLQKMRGDIHLDFALTADDAVSLEIASKFLKMDFETIDEMVIDIASEFTNVVLGNIAVKFSEKSIKTNLTPPQTLTTQEFSDDGYFCFDFETTDGMLSLYLKI